MPQSFLAMFGSRLAGVHLAANFIGGGNGCEMEQAQEEKARSDSKVLVFDVGISKH
ncbi:MAG: hypothetical protein ACYTE3_03130 [Planctomycetota bacterium]|jgi:hypothetical protein